MIAAALPANEEARLQALHETGLLDTHPEEEFDVLARLAAFICDTPIGVISLLDRQRQWFKAQIGLESSETDRDPAFCGHTILQRDAFVVSDVSKDARFFDNPLVTGDPGIRFYAGIPLETEDGFRLGSLCVIDKTPRVLTDRQLEALRLLSLQANKQINRRRQQHKMGMAAEKNRLIEHELRSSNGLFHAFMDNAPFLALMKDAQGRMVYYNKTYANWFQVDREEWLGKSAEELWPADVAAALRAHDGSVLREWKAGVVDEADDCVNRPPGQWRSYRFPFRDTAAREYVACFSVDITADKEAAGRIASYQAALEAANEKLSRLALTDELTQLLNRRAFDAALDREFATSARHRHAMSLLMVDIDDFKSFNDTFGHDVGDRVLRVVAGAVARGFRLGDTAARFGGEEFAVILANTSRNEAAETAERLRIAVRELEVQERRVTVSIGISSTPQAGPDTKLDLLRRADEALYRAKREGRDRVCVG